MSTYASRTDVENYIEGWVTDDPLALERLIVRAENDIDRIIFPLNVNLPPTQVIALSAAGGDFVVEWNGVTPQDTPSESYSVAASQLETDLQALTDIGSGNVTVLGPSPVFTLLWNNQWSQDYSATGAQIPLVGVNSSGLLPGGSSANVVFVRGRHIDPTASDINENQLVALSNATCAQVEYRNAMGEAFFVRAQYDQVRGPDFTTTGKLPFLGPKTKRELTQSGLMYHGARAKAAYSRRGVGRGWPTY